MPIKPKDDDHCFAFIGTQNGRQHWPYFIIVRPSGSIFIQAAYNDLLHFSFHRVNDKKPNFANCHYTFATDLLRNEVLTLDKNGPQKQVVEWKRKVGNQRIEAALQLIFPGKFALDIIPRPDDDKVHGIDVLEFEIEDGQALRAECLFGPDDDNYWEARFHNYGEHQWYAKLSTGERFCLNLYYENDHYGTYVRAGDHKEIVTMKNNEPVELCDYRVLFGVGWGTNAIGVVHGNPMETKLN